MFSKLQIGLWQKQLFPKHLNRYRQGEPLHTEFLALSIFCLSLSQYLLKTHRYTVNSNLVRLVNLDSMIRILAIQKTNIFSEIFSFFSLNQKFSQYQPLVRPILSGITNAFILKGCATVCSIFP